MPNDVKRWLHLFLKIIVLTCDHFQSISTLISEFHPIISPAHHCSRGELADILDNPQYAGHHWDCHPDPQGPWLLAWNVSHGTQPLPGTCL